MPNASSQTATPILNAKTAAMYAHLNVFPIEKIAHCFGCSVEADTRTQLYNHSDITQQ